METKEQGTVNAPGHVESNNQIFTIEIVNNTSAVLTAGTWTPDGYGGNKVIFQGVAAQYTQPQAFVGQGAQGSGTGACGTVTWTLAVGSTNYGTLTCVYNDPYTGDNSFSVSGDSTFNTYFTAKTLGVPPGGSVITGVVTINPITAK